MQRLIHSPCISSVLNLLFGCELRLTLSSRCSEVELVRYDKCHSETNFTAITKKIFCQCGNYHRAISSDALRFSSCSRQSWAEYRRISHGTAIRHQHPLCPGLQLGRNRPEPRLNLDLCRSLLCTADGFLSLFGFRPITCSTNKPLIAGTPSAWSAGGNSWVIFTSSKAPDLPILRCYCSKTKAQTEIDAIAEAKCRVDKVLAN
jgi:hypothetical protein